MTSKIASGGRLFNYQNHTSNEVTFNERLEALALSFTLKIYNVLSIHIYANNYDQFLFTKTKPKDT